MSERPSPPELMAAIKVLSDSEMREWLKRVMADHDGKEINPYWPLRVENTASCYRMRNSDIVEFGQRVSDAASAKLEIKAFSFKDEVAETKLTDLMSLNSAIFYAVIKTAGWVK